MTDSELSYAVVFPGQGSQSVGMLADLAQDQSIVRDTFQEAAEVLDVDLWALAQQGPAESISKTEITQPLMFVSGVALWRLWSSQSSHAPSVLAGHSLGEFCALVAGGVLSFTEALKLVQIRANLMGAAVVPGEGGMAAILGMEDEAVVAVCEAITGDRIVEAVNFNSPGQVAISGHIDALEKAVESASGAGAKKAIMLPVSVPNHSSLMRSAGESLANEMDKLTFSDATLPIMQNTFAVVPESSEALLTSLKQHVYSPVYWTKAYRTMLESYQCSVVVELGPGKVLAGLGKRIERSVPVMPVDSPAGLEKALDKIHETVKA